ncbi:unnamed protein product [Miscanthus lutarioriparius]|uniref:Uncharacterized protein n=1 Tax=Miscanthus lutarioriparius TaxID=422564 RepID=A0A811P0G4_9POAL|nr:unnamed protein product [Miscanthus lutarioriparius]
MARDVNRGTEDDGHPLPQPAPSPSPAATEEGTDRSKANNNLRDRVSFSSSSSRPRPSCWGSIRIRRIGRIQSRTRTGSDEHDTRASLGDRGRCACGCGGKAGAAVGLRSLLQRNDFYCDDCNPHR